MHRLDVLGGKYRNRVDEAIGAVTPHPVAALAYASVLSPTGTRLFVPHLTEQNGSTTHTLPWRLRRRSAERRDLSFVRCRRRGRERGASWGQRCRVAGRVAREGCWIQHRQVRGLAFERAVQAGSRGRDERRLIACRFAGDEGSRRARCSLARPGARGYPSVRGWRRASRDRRRYEGRYGDRLRAIFARLLDDSSRRGASSASPATTIRCRPTSPPAGGSSSPSSTGGSARDGEPATPVIRKVATTVWCGSSGRGLGRLRRSSAGSEHGPFGWLGNHDKLEENMRRRLAASSAAVYPTTTCRNWRLTFVAAWSLRRAMSFATKARSTAVASSSLRPRSAAPAVIDSTAKEAIALATRLALAPRTTRRVISDASSRLCWPLRALFHDGRYASLEDLTRRQLRLDGEHVAALERGSRSARHVLEEPLTWRDGVRRYCRFRVLAVVEAPLRPEPRPASLRSGSRFGFSRRERPPRPPR